MVKAVVINETGQIIMWDRVREEVNKTHRIIKYYLAS